MYSWGVKDAYQVLVAEFVEEELVCSSGGCGEHVGGQTQIALLNCKAQSAHDPLSQSITTTQRQLQTDTNKTTHLVMLTRERSTVTLFTQDLLNSLVNIRRNSIHSFSPLRYAKHFGQSNNFFQETKIR